MLFSSLDGGGGWVDAAGVLDGWLLVRWLGEGRGIKVKCRSLVISNLVSLQCWAVEVNHMYLLKRNSAYAEQPFWEKLAGEVSIK